MTQTKPRIPGMVALMATLLSSFLFQTLPAQTVTQLAKLVDPQRSVIAPNNRTVNAGFGSFSAISGNWAVMTSYNTEGSMGAAYLYEFSGGTWNFRQRIVASDRALSDAFGISVAISGNYLVIGAPNDDDVSTGSTITDAGSAYIFERDPVTNTWSEKQKVIASDRVAFDRFGYSVSVSGNYVVVGAYQQDLDAAGGNALEDAGAAYIFERNAVSNTWSQQQKLVNTDRDATDYFGVTVAIDGNRLVVGAYGEDADASGGNPVAEAGAGYVYVRDVVNNTWSLQQKIVSNDRASGISFGYFVSLSGNYMVISAFNDGYDASGGNFVSQAGSVYIFEWSNGTWTQQQKLVASDRGGTDFFGYSVSISGDYLVVGAYQNDLDAAGGGATLFDAGAAFVFKRNTVTNTWSQQQKLVNSDRANSDMFGSSVAISGNFIVAGAKGEDEDEAGANTVSGAGSAYLFQLNGGTGSWSQQQKVVAADPKVGATFGASVSVSGNWAVLGAANEANTGAAYLFERVNGNWTYRQRIIASDPVAGDLFGFSVSLSGDNLVVGAYQQDYNATGGGLLVNAGAVYIFSRNSGTNTWSQQQKLVASDRVTGDFFGYSVSMSGDKLVVGAYQQDWNAPATAILSNAGAAYIFQRNSGTNNWSLVQKIVAADRSNNNFFGRSVSISGEYLMVGADQQTTNASGSASLVNAGAVYFFQRNSNTNLWSQVQKVVASDRTVGDQFGFSVSLSGDYAVVGVPLQDYNATGGGFATSAGAAYVFQRNSSTNVWSQWQKLVASDRAASDMFGFSVSISGDNLVVGAYQEDEDASGNATLLNSGAAYVFQRNSGTNIWGQLQKLVASDRAAGEQFGFSTGLAGSDLLVGANFGWSDAAGTNNIYRAGSAYVFQVPPSAAIATGSLSSTTLCAGAQLSLPYTATGTFNNGNVFVAQLSDASGSFANATTIGSVTATVSGTISITIPANTTPGTGYRIRVTGSGPAITGTDNGVDLMVSTNPDLTVSQTNVSCFGGSNGAASVNATGRTATSVAYTYSWSPAGGNAAAATGLSAGTYTVLVTNTATSCQASASVVITAPAAAVSGATVVTHLTCFGGTTGVINLTPAGGTAPYSFVWNDGAMTEDRTNLSAGSYSVIITDANGCQATVSNINLSQPATPVSGSTVVTNASCAGNDGAINLTPAGGTAPYTFQWSGGITTEDRSSLAPGFYVVTISDANGCTATVTATVGAPASFTASINLTAANQVLCSSSGATTISVSGGPANGSINYSVNGGSAQTLALDANGEASISTGALSANATYQVLTVSNGTCTIASSAAITIYVGTIIANTPGNTTYCSGASVPAYAFSGNFPAGTQYSWTVSNGAAIGLNAPGGTGTQLPAFTASNTGNALQTATLMVVPQLALPTGCKVTPQYWVIRVQPQPSVTITSGGGQSVCAGALTAPITLQGNAAAGMSFSWTSSNPAVGSAATGAATSASPAIPAFLSRNNTGTPSIASTFTITPVIGACTGAAVSTTLTVGSAVTALSYASPLCGSDALNYSPTLAGSTGGVFSYLNNATGTATGLALNSTTGAITPMRSLPGTYTITYAIAGASCGASASAQVTINQGVVVNAPSNRTVCTGQPLSIAFSSPQDGLVPFTYSWTIGGISGVTAQAAGLPASGTGSTINAVPVNATGAPIRFTIQVRAVATGGNCSSAARTFTLTVNPAGSCPTITQSTGTGGGPATARAIARPQQQEGSDGSLTVGPNPTQSRVTLRLDAELMKQGGMWSVQLLTQQGAPVSRAASFTGNTTTVDLSGQPAGVYVLQLVDQKSGRIVRRQVIKL